MHNPTDYSCETCKYLSITPLDDSCPNENCCNKTGMFITDITKNFLEFTGCASHSNFDTEQIFIRDLSDQDLRNEVLEYCKTHSFFYTDTIANDLGLDLEKVVLVVEDLINEGIIN